jgi:hypothetical protein
MVTRAGCVLLWNVRSATLCFGGCMCVQREAKRRDAVGREIGSQKVKTFEVYWYRVLVSFLHFRVVGFVLLFPDRWDCGSACAYVSS